MFARGLMAVGKQHAMLIRAIWWRGNRVYITNRTTDGESWRCWSTGMVIGSGLRGVQHSHVRLGLDADPSAVTAYE